MIHIFDNRHPPCVLTTKYCELKTSNSLTASDAETNGCKQNLIRVITVAAVINDNLKILPCSKKPILWLARFLRSRQLGYVSLYGEQIIPQ